MNKSINKTELIHIRIEPDVKVQSENIFKRLVYSSLLFLGSSISKGKPPLNITWFKNIDTA